MSIDKALSEHKEIINLWKSVKAAHLNHDKLEERIVTIANNVVPLHAAQRLENRIESLEKRLPAEEVLLSDSVRSWSPEPQEEPEESPAEIAAGVDWIADIESYSRKEERMHMFREGVKYLEKVLMSEFTHMHMLSYGEGHIRRKIQEASERCQK